MEFDDFTTSQQCEELIPDEFIENLPNYPDIFFTSLGTKVTCEEMLEIYERVNTLNLNHECHLYLTEHPIPAEVYQDKEEGEFTCRVNFLSEFTSLFQEIMTNDEVDNYDILSECFNQACDNLMKNKS